MLPHGLADSTLFTKKWAWDQGKLRKCFLSKALSDAEIQGLCQTLSQLESKESNEQRSEKPDNDIQMRCQVTVGRSWAEILDIGQGLETRG